MTARRTPQHPVRQRVIALAVLLCSVHNANGQQDDDTLLAGAHNTTAKLTWRVLVSEGNPPFNYIDSNGKPRGLSVQMLELLLAEVAKAERANAEQAGIKLTGADAAPGSATTPAATQSTHSPIPTTPIPITPMPWHRIALSELDTPNTLIASIVRLPEREQKVIWLDVLYRQSESLFALGERNLPPLSTADLAAYRIGAPRNSAAHRKLLNLGVAAEQIEAGSPVQNLRKLFAGRLDLVSIQPAALAWLLKNEGLTERPLQVVYQVLPETGFYLVATLNSDPSRLSQLRQHFQHLEQSGAFPKLRQEAGLTPN